MDVPVFTVNEVGTELLVLAVLLLQPCGGIQPLFMQLVLEIGIA